MATVVFSNEPHDSKRLIVDTAYTTCTIKGVYACIIRRPRNRERETERQRRKGKGKQEEGKKVEDEAEEEKEEEEKEREKISHKEDRGRKRNLFLRMRHFVSSRVTYLLCRLDTRETE